MTTTATGEDGLEARVDTALADVYRTLGALYLEPPEAETVETLRTWCRLVADDEGLPAPVVDAVETVRSASTDPEEVRPAFTRLFLGISEAQSPPPPYESLYVDGRLNGPSSIELEAFYLDAGYELAVDDELIDHAGYELAFLGVLCDRGDRERQRVFLERFVGDWLPAFHEAARETDPPQFYRGVFALTEAIIDLHIEALEEAGVTVE